MSKVQLSETQRAKIQKLISVGIVVACAAIGFAVGGPFGFLLGAVASIAALRYISNQWKKKYRKIVCDWIHKKFHKNFFIRWIIKLFHLREDKLKDILLDAVEWVDDGMVLILNATLFGRTEKGHDIQIGLVKLKPEEARALELVTANGEMANCPQSIYTSKEILEMTEAA